MICAVQSSFSLKSTFVQTTTKMKIAVIALLVLCAVVAIQASPNKKVEVKSTCPKACTMLYEPVCAANPDNPSDKPRLFSNKCVMKSHNCEHKSNLQEVSFDKCKEAGGIRLS